MTLHDLAHAAARLHPSLMPNDLRGIEGCAVELEARLAATNERTSPEEIQALASEADRCASACGAQHSAWNRAFQAACHRRNPNVNVDSTVLLSTPAVGARAGQRERSFWERYRRGR